MTFLYLFLSLAALCLLLATADADQPSWTLGPFVRADEVNPIITPQAGTLFDCPMRGRPIAWEEYATFNPAAVVRDGKVCVLYRAEDATGEEKIGAHTSRVGLAESADGLHFTRRPQPVFYPADDGQKAREWDGGCEDPRIVETDDGRYVLMYTQWDRHVARLAVATSRDLVHWEKHGFIFAQAGNGRFANQWSKSGSIVCRRQGDHLIATQIGGKYWMYWGELSAYLATSTDLIHWEPMLDAKGELAYAFTTRPGKFDSQLVEPGPPAVLTGNGIVLIYNGANSPTNGDPALPPRVYCGGQALMDAHDPTKLIARVEHNFVRPERAYETMGQYKDGTVFLEALVPFGNKWFLYYGTADSRVGVFVADR